MKHLLATMILGIVKFLLCVSEIKSRFPKV